MLDVVLTNSEEKPHCDEVAFDCIENTRDSGIPSEALARWINSRKSSWLGLAGPLVRSVGVYWLRVKGKVNGLWG